MGKSETFARGWCPNKGHDFYRHKHDKDNEDTAKATPGNSGRTFERNLMERVGGNMEKTTAFGGVAVLGRIGASTTGSGTWTLERGGAGVGEPPPGTTSDDSGDRLSGREKDYTQTSAIDTDRNLPFEQIQRKYQEKIFNLILRMVRDRDDAEDLTVETFVNAFKHWGRFRGEARVSTWLHQIAYNNCKNHFKQKDRRRDREPVSLDDSIETDGGELTREVADWRNAPERLLLEGELAQRTQEAMDALPEDYRTVLVLALQEDLSYEEIARITGLSLPAVKTRLHRARNRVKQRLEPYYRGWTGRNG